MIDYSKLKVGEILSETSYYVVTKKDSNGIEADSSVGIKGIELSRKYVEQILASASQIDKEEQMSQTDIVNVILANPRTACSIYFKKQDEKKKVGDYKAEKAAKIHQIQNAKVSDVEKLLSDLIDNPIVATIPGAMRLIKGYHNGTQDERGRIQFIDMEDKSIMKGVDPRTIEYAIVNNIKYIKK
jgi:hypothetical protein